MFRHYRVIFREPAFITLPSYISSVETCRSLLIYKFIVIVLLLVDLQNSKKSTIYVLK
jgi:hypothetical protein